MTENYAPERDAQAPPRSGTLWRVILGAFLGLVLGYVLGYLAPRGISGVVTLGFAALGAFIGHAMGRRRFAKRSRAIQARDESLAPYADTSYFVQRLGREEGPYTINQVSDRMRHGEIRGDTALRRADGGDPFLARELDHLTPADTSAKLGGWGFAVFFFGWVGGLVGYLMLQDENRPRAKKVLKWGLVWTAIWAAIAILFYIVMFAVVVN